MDIITDVAQDGVTKFPIFPQSPKRSGAFFDQKNLLEAEPPKRAEKQNNYENPDLRAEFCCTPGFSFSVFFQNLFHVLFISAN